MLSATTHSTQGVPMKFKIRDWIFVAVIITVLGILLMSTYKEKPKKVPYDDKHQQFYEAMMNKGGDRMEVEKGCLTCHGSQNIPLSKNHPPKEQCLICHTFLLKH